MMKFMLLIVTLSISYVFAATDDCALCGTASQLIPVKKCASQTATSVPIDVCCDSLDNASTCPEGRKCRSVQYSEFLGCSSGGAVDPCLEPSALVSLSVSIEVAIGPGACCATCHCVGDPHCYSFNGTADDWILCEDRKIQKHGSCLPNKNVCLSQLDQDGRQCQWNPATERDSTCLINPATPDPTMLFFQNSLSSVSFILGERGIPAVVEITEGSNITSLNATTCKHFLKHPPAAPWTSGYPWVSNGIVPPGTITLLKDRGTASWAYRLQGGLNILTLNCIPEGTAVSAPHIDVYLSVVGTSPNTPQPGVTGFCEAGVIPKGKATHSISDEIRIHGYCIPSKLAQIATAFNGNIRVPTKEVPKEVKKFCQKYILPDSSQTIKDCQKNILKKNGYGWPKVFCAAVTLPDQNPADCTIPGSPTNSPTPKAIGAPSSSPIISNDNCANCLTDIEDGGWSTAIQKWSPKNGASPDAICLTIDQLPADLIGCEGGIRIQYQVNGTWITYKAIPQGYTLCGASGTFTNIDDAVLFKYPIRFYSCSAINNPILCPNSDVTACDSQVGFTVSLVTAVSSTSPQLGIVTMFQSGELICADGSTTCGNIPPGFQVCPTCTGSCKPTGYTGPCADPNNVCEDMCMNPIVG